MEFKIWCDIYPDPDESFLSAQNPNRIYVKGLTHYSVDGREVTKAEYDQAVRVELMISPRLYTQN